MSTLKTNNIQHVDRSDPSIIINTDGSVNIAGTMTYEDVTNVDAVGIITGRSNIDAQKQVHVGTGVSVKAGGLNVTAGITTVQALQATTGTFSGDVDIADKLIHTGDTDTFIEFGTNAIMFDTAGSERLRITSDGLIQTKTRSAGVRRMILSGSPTNTAFNIEAHDGATGTSANTNQGELGLYYNDGSTLTDEAVIKFYRGGGSGDGYFGFNTGSTEKLRISSAGLVSLPVAGNLQVGGAGSGETDSKIYVANTGGNAYIQIKGADSSGTVGIKLGRNSVANRAGIDWSASTDSLVFRTGGTNDRLSITSGGQIGIGSAIPRTNFKLDVNGDLSLGESGGTDNSYIDQKQNGHLELINSGRDDNSAGLRINRMNNIAGDTTWFRDVNVYDGKGTSVVYIDGSAASVGINQSSPDTMLHLTGDPASNGAIIRLENPTAMGQDELVGSVEFEKQDASGAGAGLCGGMRCHSDDSYGARTYLAFSTRGNSTGAAAVDTERFRITAQGGVTFNGDTAYANALNDYEEGSWTPECRIETRAASDSPIDNVQGNYIKVGDLVYAFGQFQLNGTPSERSDGRAIEIRNFPYAHNHSFDKVSSDCRVTGFLTSATYGSDIYFLMRMLSGQTYARLEIIQLGYNGTRNASNVMQDNMYVIFQFTYPAT